MSKFLKMMRPHQWAKQVIVVIPVLSLGRLLSFESAAHSLSAAITFTFFASLVYVVNDYFDLAEDQLDPVRQKRPLASGLVSKSESFFLLVVLSFIGSFTNFVFSAFPIATFSLLIFYVFINALYSKLKLKNHNILGISIIALGFPLRFWFGCLFLGIEISYWALVLLMELALFMLSVKRYQRTLRKVENSNNSVIHEFWLLAAIVFAAFFSASYAGFISAPGTQAIWGSTALLLSAIPMALAIVRFLEIATQEANWNSSDVTDSLFKDWPLVILSIVYMATMLIGSLTHG
jgi:4-hydroxybenzoate polyprenyltransferase